MAMTITVPDIMTTLQNSAVKRVINAGIFDSEEIQRENTAAPDVLPYCSVTVIASGEWEGESQTRKDKNVIVEFDVYTREMSNTQLARGLAYAIEREFGIKDAVKRTIALPGWNGVSATVATFSRGAASTESDRGFYRLPVILYVNVTMCEDAEYSV